MRKLIRIGFFFKIVLPAVLALLFFIISLFKLILPSFEKTALDQKGIMIHELTNTTWSILLKYHTDEKEGLISEEVAKNSAISEIETLRYGIDKKDYFWITDLTPVMIMHPYVHELEGENLHNFLDPDGKRIFIEALEIAKTKGEGFINYKWQHKDDSLHIVPKMSFVKIFEPWGWIIGTGIYLDDIDKEMSSLTRKMILVLIAITIIISFIISFIAYQSHNIDKKRRKAEALLIESKEKYRSLVESSPEGIILLVKNTISYTNTFIQKWLQYSEAELSKMELKDIILFPEERSRYNISEISNLKEERREEVTLKRKGGSLAAAVLTVMPICYAGKEGVLLTFHDSHENQSIKSELRDLKIRLKNLSDYTNIGTFRFPLKGKNRLIEYNSTLISILGYVDNSEFMNIPIENIFPQKSDLKNLLRDLTETQVFSREISLKRRDGTRLKVNITLIKSGSDYCDGIVVPFDSKKITDELIRFSHELSVETSSNYKPVSEFGSPLVTCPSYLTIEDALEIMQNNNSSYVTVTINRVPAGVVTERDIILYLFRSDTNRSAQITHLMNSPLTAVYDYTPVYEAVSVMDSLGLSYVFIKNNKEKVTTILQKSSIFGIYSSRINPLERKILKSESLSSLLSIRNKIPTLIEPLINESDNASAITKIISGYNDDITQKIIESAIKEMGEPPAPFAFIALGSEGREELVFSSDQDNALIYSDDFSGSDSDKAKEYFLELGQRICKNLNESGLQLCSGGYMANNPKWCQPLSVWKEYFSDWIVNAEPVNIMNISVFFDLRFVYGNREIFNSLEDYIFNILNGKSAFFYFLANSVSNFKPPTNIFGNLLTETTGKTGESLDVKRPISQIVMLARLYALHNNIRLKGTYERIKTLCNYGVFNPESCQEIAYHYNFLSLLRLRSQVDHIRKKESPGNSIPLGNLSSIENLILKKVFSQMSGYSEKISATFMSSYKG
jgi:PAS domain S-box-containing protein